MYLHVVSKNSNRKKLNNIIIYLSFSSTDFGGEVRGQI